MAITQQKVLTKVFGDPQKRILRRLQKKVDEINALGPKYKKLSDKELAGQTDVLRKRLQKKSVTLDTILPDAFAEILADAAHVKAHGGKLAGDFVEEADNGGGVQAVEGKVYHHSI